MTYPRIIYQHCDPQEVNVERLKDAYQVLAGVPKEKYYHRLYRYLGEYGADPRVAGVGSCGTLACGAGWLALHPDFGGRSGSLRDRLDRVGKKLGFYVSGHHRIFDVRGGSEYDRESGLADFSDKALVLYRIRRELGQGRQQARHGAKRDAA